MRLALLLLAGCATQLPGPPLWPPYPPPPPAVEHPHICRDLRHPGHRGDRCHESWACREGLVCDAATFTCEYELE